MPAARSASRGRKTSPARSPTPSKGRKSASKARSPTPSKARSSTGRSSTPSKKAASPVSASNVKSSKTFMLAAGNSKEYPVIVPPHNLMLPAIQKQIPSHYFKQNTFWGFFYLSRDLLQIAATVYVMHQYGMTFIDAGMNYIADYFGAGKVETTIFATLFKFAVWNIYWFIQGLNFTGVWVLAHECGHQSFSPYRVVNDTVGWFCHSALMVPYHSWRISHGTHHKNTNHCDKDTVFVPFKMANPAAQDALAEAPIVSLIFMIITFTIGWPGYLLWNATGQDYGRRTNHFEPGSPLFQKKDRMDIVVSDIGIFAAIGAVIYASQQFSFWTVACWYLIPYMWNNFWLVFITYLQHSDIRLPHYDAEEWTFVRGGLAAIDRSFGAPINWWLHHINDSHVQHHLFSTMPFYNAIEVTRKYNREIFGDLYQTDDRSLMTMLWESWKQCRYVVPTEGVSIFRR